MIEYIKGDVTEAEEFVILQGCNAQGAMNSGVAKAIRDKWPEVFAQYRFEYETRGLWVGDIHPCFVRNRRLDCRLEYVEKVIINGITQRYYGTDPNVVYVDYIAIECVLRDTRELLENMNQHTFATVKIGAGLGNGDWNKIEALIDKVFPDFWVKIYVPE